MVVVWTEEVLPLCKMLGRPGLDSLQVIIIDERPFAGSLLILLHCFVTAQRREFRKKRKAHYNEFQAVALARKLMEEDEDELKVRFIQGSLPFS